MKNVLARFDELLTAMHRAPTTRRLYVAAARQWLNAGGQPHRLDAEIFNRRLFARRQHVGQSTLNIELKALRAFYRCMGLLGIAPAGIEQQISRGKRAKPRLVRWFTDEQVGALLAQPDLASFIGLRDHTMIRVLYETGLRAGELVALGCGDVLQDASIYVAGGKSGRSRYVPISTELLGLIDVYTSKRGEQRPGKRSALWITQRGLPLAGAQSTWEIISRHARAALGVAAGYERMRRTHKRQSWSGQYPHMLRASFATALLQRGCPLPAIAQMLGHASLDTTSLYLGADIEHLRDAVAKHPRNRRRSE